MIKFTDKRLYVQGIGTAIMTDPATDDILYFSDKFQEGNITTASDSGIVNAGIGSSPVIMIPSNANVSVAVTAADYSEYAKGAAVGATVTYGAPVMICQEVTASGTSISIDVSGGAPIAELGRSDVICYVQEVDAASPIATYGIAYALNPTSGAISGFTSVNGKKYLVSYYVSRANASLTTITSNMKGKVVRFVLQRPVYVNVNAALNQGDLAGMLYEIIPNLQLMPDGASNSGSQTAPTTTGITGQALVYDDETIKASCSDCSNYGTPLMYRVYVPCDATSGIEGIIGILGGAVSVASGSTFQLAPAVVVNGKLSYNVPATEFAYESSATGVATVGAATGIVAGVSSGSAEITVTYTVGATTYTDYVNVTVTA